MTMDNHLVSFIHLSREKQKRKGKPKERMGKGNKLSRKPQKTDIKICI